jgi:hypothetical protein
MKNIKILTGALLIAFGALGGAYMFPTQAQASPAMCGAHAEHSDSPNGFASSTAPGAAVGADPTYIGGCAGDSGAAIGSTAAGGTVSVPSVSTDAS